MTLSPDAETKKRITIVTPVFNEIEALPIFYRRLSKVIAEYTDRYDFDVLFTNNSSTDGTLEYIQELNKTDPSVQVITLSRNFGYTPSVLSGITHAKGDAIILIDADCEDPPEILPQFIEEWEKGHDIVYGLRKNRKESIFMVISRKLFYRFTRSIADQDFILDMAEFSLFTRRVRDEVIKAKTMFPFIRSELAFVGFKRKGIPYTRQKRVAGETYLNIFSLYMKAISFILTASTFPLRLVGYAGAGLILFDTLSLGLHWLGSGAIDVITLAAVNFIFFIYAVMFIAVYIARIYRNGMMHPIFIIDWEKTILNGHDADDLF